MYIVHRTYVLQTYCKGHFKFQFLFFMLKGFRIPLRPWMSGKTVTSLFSPHRNSESLAKLDKPFPRTLIRLAPSLELSSLCALLPEASILSRNTSSRLKITKWRQVWDNIVVVSNISISTFYFRNENVNITNFAKKGIFRKAAVCKYELFRISCQKVSDVMKIRCWYEIKNKDAYFMKFSQLQWKAYITSLLT